MDATRFDESPKVLANVTDRRGAMRSLSAAGLALLAALGLDAADARKQGIRGNGANRDQTKRTPVQSERMEKAKRGPPGPTGRAGPGGVDGAPGPTGPAGSSRTGWEFIVGTPTPQNETATKEATALCSGEKNVLGGGYLVGSSAGNTAEISVTRNAPGGSGHWHVIAVDDDAGNVGTGPSRPTRSARTSAKRHGGSGVGPGVASRRRLPLRVPDRAGSHPIASSLAPPAPAPGTS